MTDITKASPNCSSPMSQPAASTNGPSTWSWACSPGCGPNGPDALQDAVLDALRDLVAASTGLGTALVVGAPLRADGLLFNCAVVVCEGTVRGVVPKSYLPSYREFYEKRYFAAARDTAARQIRLLGQDVAFGPDLLFDAEGLDDFSFHAEICEDL